MSKNQQTYTKQDLFQSGKAYRNSFLGQGEGAPPGTNLPYGGGFPYNGASGGPFDNMPEGNFPVPYQQPPTQNSSSFLGNLPIKDIKSAIDRMGGIDGIMGMVNKVNAVVKNVQQMTPMIKLLMGSFMSKAKTANSHTRKRRRRPRSRRRNTARTKYKNKKTRS